MRDRAFSLYEVEQFLREAGAKRVTEDAVTELEKDLERLAELITHKATIYAKHAGRNKWIKKSDIVLVKGDYKNPYTFSAKASMTNPISKRVK